MESSGRRPCRASWWACLITALLCSVLVPRISRAENPVETARAEEANRLFGLGREAVEAGRLPEALKRYRAAWRLRKTADIAASLGQVEFELGYLDLATRHFAFADAHVAPSMSPDRRRSLARRLEELRPHVGAVDLTLSPPEAAVQLDEEAVEPEILETGIYVMPGQHVVEATAPGYVPARREFVVAAGGTARIDLRLIPEDGSPAAPAGESGGRGRHVGVAPAWVGGALALAGLGVGVGYGVAAGQTSEEARRLEEQFVSDRSCGQPVVDADHNAAEACQQLETTLKRLDRERNLSTAGYVVGEVGVVATVVAIVLARAYRARETGARALPALEVGPQRAWIGIRAPLR